MKIAVLVVLLALIPSAALAAAPDISKVPPHPRLYIGGMDSNPSRINPDILAERAKTHKAQFDMLNASSDLPARALSAKISPDPAKLAAVVDALKKYKVNRGEDLARAALAYDWVAGDLPEAERKALAKHLGDQAEAHVPYVGRRINPWDNNPLRRDMGVGLMALAIAGDDDRAQTLLNDSWEDWARFIEITGDGVPQDDLVGRGLPGGGWPEGHDYDRHGTRYAMIFFLGLRSATGMDVFTGSDYWSQKPYFQIYTVLPDGRHILPFQDDDNPYIIRHDREVMLFLANEYKNPYARYYLNHVNHETDSVAAIFEFLFDEPQWEEKPFTDLPLAHYIPGIGMVYARSGWGNNDTYLGFCASDWYVYHQNNAQNVFSVYRNAPLVVKDGVYDGDVHDHYVNYSIRTVAYSGSITVKDPDEQYRGPDGLEEAANDGGQMINQWKGNPQSLAMWREQARQTEHPMRDIVDFLAFDGTDKYCYMAADSARAYRPGKVEQCARQIVFLYPDTIVVFDRVTSGKAEFVKKLRFHAPEEMEVSGHSAIVTTRKANGTTIPGRLFITSLLPKDAKVERVDGIATYDGESHKGPDPYNDQLLCPYHLVITAPQEKTSYFLTVLYACNVDVEKAPEVKVTEETPDAVTVSVDNGAHVLRFSKTGDVAWEQLSK